MKRRNFIKRSAYAALGLALSSGISGQNKLQAAVKPINRPTPESWPENKISLAWIGHSTVFINFFGVKILTDPVFFERVGVYFFGYTWGPSRYTLPALFISEIPKPDLILLSHSHMDHTDYESLKYFSKKFPSQIDVVSSYMSKDVFEDLNWRSIKELDWGEEYFINGLTIRALEVKHFGWRFPWEKDRSRGYMKGARSYNAYLLKRNGKKMLFGGDTANTDKLNAIKDENVDIAIMPVGAYNPWKFNHCNPEEALKMADNLNAKYFVPVHCNTFQQGREPKEEPIQWVKRSIVNYRLQLALDDIGKTFSL
ncbi:MAG: MBL fold metallo-hydrolase [Bacteroidota bacterium]|nr:MBL fold metallo-hydrolase [Bacteroidota bacterium]MDP4189970.1 MBL fold metallo-hydrolase [Bacteroidota bacterium]MDP4193402.1 MBL fold metallo-hydrolase [Bacteroidota bacterium]